MEPTDREKLILLGIFIDREEILGQPVFGYGHAAEKAKLKKAQDGFVAQDANRWMELKGSGGDFNRATKSLKRLQKLGLIERRGRDVGLTSAGEKLVREPLE